MGNKIKVLRQIKLVIGCTLLVASGLLLGTFESMNYFLDLDNSSLWIPMTALLCLFLGMIFLLYRDEQINAEKGKNKIYKWLIKKEIDNIHLIIIIILWTYAGFTAGAYFN